jgi:hypothetical protein
MCRCEVFDKLVNYWQLEASTSFFRAGPKLGASSSGDSKSSSFGATSSVSLVNDHSVDLMLLDYDHLVDLVYHHWNLVADHSQLVTLMR